MLLSLMQRNNKDEAIIVLERRKNPRIRQVFLPACLTIGSKPNVAIIRDLSDSGIGIHCSVDVPLGEKVTIQWGSNLPIEGIVGWQDGDRLGIITECSPLAHSDGAPVRASRFSVKLPVEISSGDEIYEGELRNLSTKGLSIKHGSTLTRGSLVRVSLSFRSFEECTVRWSDKGLSGLLLKAPIRLEEIREILAFPEEGSPFLESKISNTTPHRAYAEVEPLRTMGFG